MDLASSSPSLSSSSSSSFHYYNGPRFHRRESLNQNQSVKPTNQIGPTKWASAGKKKGKTPHSGILNY